MQNSYSGLEKFIIPVVEGLGYEFVGSERVNQDQHHILRIYIDKDSGISHDDCRKVSSQVEAVLDVEADIQSAYLLEVSSPGLDRKIFTVEQLVGQVGKQVKLKLNAAINNRKKYTGILKDVSISANTCLLIISDTEVIFSLSGVDEVRLVPDIKL